MGSGLDTDSRTAWISQGFERLIHRVRGAPAAVHFDVLIIGSGYGGAVTAATFAGRRQGNVPVRVGMLERGKEYLPGSFPTGLGELPRHIRRERNNEGLFDIRPGPEVTTIVANGVGGGSLINAGVMEIPSPSVFQKGWPNQLANLAGWHSFFDRASDLLGARVDGVPNTITAHADGLPQKFSAFKSMAPSNRFRPAAVTIAMAGSTSTGNVSLNKCTRCGDCATGCNFGAKNSLDVNLLVRAQQNGAEIFSGATVLNIEKDGAVGWIVNAVHTNATLRARDGEVLRIRARKVVLAAGTLGSNEILRRSHMMGLSIANEQLGERCSTNGDMLVVDYGTRAAVNSVADAAVQPSKRAVGPTITGVIDLRDTAGVLIEEMAVPASLRLAFTEIFATTNTLHGLDKIDWSTHRQGFPNDDAYAVPRKCIEHSALYAVMADDGAAGSMELDGAVSDDRDGIARIRWEKLPDLPIFDTQVDILTGLAKNSGGRIMANPLWKLLPSELTWLLREKRGPLTTVHPLGGCTMAETGSEGVVNHLGQVFSTGTSSAVHDGLVVLDGSIIPTALGTNPALAISAVALRAAEALALEWGYDVAPPAAPVAALVRPIFRSTDSAVPPAKTEVEVIERIVGPVRLKLKNGATGSYIVEMTLRFLPKALADLTPSIGGDPVLKVAADQSDPVARSAIRIFPRAEWEMLEKSWDPPGLREQKLDAIAHFSAPLTGGLRVFERQRSWALGRIGRAGKAWLFNRGLRDIYQAIVDGDGGPGPLARIKSGLAIASRSGEIRAFRYDLRIGIPDAGAKIALNGDHVVGTKTFTYARRGNPWRQLMEVALEQFPGLTGSTPHVLRLDLGYLARIGVPLFRITGQSDGIGAIGEQVTVLGYFLRLLLGQHIWSFRAPDKDVDPANDVIDFSPPATLQLPGGGSVTAQRIPIPMGSEKPNLGGGRVPGEVLITRYPHPGTIRRPVVMLHGYSAGGTTFAHHAVSPNFASYLWNTGRDIWVADMRTSPAHATATQAWSFDQIGKEDVKKVIETAAANSVDGKVDVIAHCMGAVVFSIAALEGRLNDLVDRVAFTQVGPLVVFTPANVFRAYAMRYLIDFLPDKYEFNPKNPTLADDLWDRVLSTLPYPVEEFDVENPVCPWKRTPWTRTRHRMDALYGRDFNVANMEPEMLRFIDEHFGALSLKTVATTLHFVRYALMTNHEGRNLLVSRRKFRENWVFPAFSVHGAENGLSHVSTVDRMQKILDDAGRVYVAPFINPGAGHQDALVGTKRHATFQKIQQFLDADIPSQPTDGNTKKTAYPPWIGPIITEERPDTPALVLRVGSLPSHRMADGVVMLRVQQSGNQILRPDNPALPWDLAYIIDHMVVHRSAALENGGWDAFEAPLPTIMPGHDPAHPGNALLVLIVYDEPSELFIPARGLFRAVASERQVFWFDPIGHRDEKPDNSFLFESFEQMAEATFRALVTPRLHSMSDDKAETRQGRLAYRGLAKLKSVTFEPDPQPVASGGSSMMMNFELPAGQGTLERLIDMDRDLLNGVVPYDAPTNPPSAPIEAGTSFSLASCQYPAGFFDGPVAGRSYVRIAEHLQGTVGIKPRFMLFVGDQVYVDPTAGLYDPASEDDRYRLPYEAWLRQRDVRNALRQIPSFMLLDDHEIVDNWEPLSDPDDETNQETKKRGLEAFQKYQRGIRPGLEAFDFDGFHFFMLDTRTERTHRKVDNLANAHLFASDPAQPNNTMERLKDWLSTAPGPKFVVTPLMLLPRHRRAVQRDRRLDPGNLSSLHSDGWDGYPNSLREVLTHIATNQIHNVVFLSGDEHRGCIATIDLLDAANTPVTRIHSIHTAGMYAPYPFANSIDEEIVDSETIDIATASGSFKCVVNATRPPPGDGATFFFVRKVGADWKLDCEFADGWSRTLTL
ncbi:alkaline phosphatase D family protein [Paramesorhizobium deserti]|nr:alkaline phosphatase D family protein [Paramesorhizobium deserti]